MEYPKPVGKLLSVIAMMCSLTLVVLSFYGLIVTIAEARLASDLDFLGQQPTNKVKVVIPHKSRRSDIDAYRKYYFQNKWNQDDDEDYYGEEEENDMDGHLRTKRYFPVHINIGCMTGYKCCKNEKCRAYCSLCYSKLVLHGKPLSIKKCC